MANVKSFFARLWKDESGQGTAEYVLLIAIVVGLVIMYAALLVVLNLLVDFAYTLLDPRVKYE